MSNRLRELAKPYLQDYLEGKEGYTITEIAKLIKVNRNTLGGVMNDLVQDMIHNKPKSDLVEIPNSKQITHLKEVKIKNFTVSDWDSMTEEQKQPYKL